MVNPIHPEKIIGIVGYAGSGKDTVASILEEKYNFFHISLGDWLRKNMSRQGKSATREVQTATANRYRQQISVGYIIDSALKEELPPTRESVILSGIYSPSEGDYIKDEINGVILGVTVEGCDSIMKRYKRIVDRSDGSRDQMSYEEFVLANGRESSGGYLGANIPKLIDMADFIVNNSLGQIDVESQVDIFIRESGLA